MRPLVAILPVLLGTLAGCSRIESEAQAGPANSGGSLRIQYPPGAGRMFCERQASRDGHRGDVADLGALPSQGFSCGVYGRGMEGEDRAEIRGVPVWQWKARCWLWTKGEYEWAADSGVVVTDGGAP